MLCEAKLSLVTTCMGREEHLAQSLPNWLSFPQIDEIVVVDWSSPGNMKEIINRFQDKKITHVRIPDQKFYDANQSRNIGVRISTGYFIILCDADVKLGPNSLDSVKTSQDIIYMRSGTVLYSGYYVSGTCILTKKMYQELGGYNENLKECGYSDIDFYNRAQAAYPHQKSIKGLQHIDHSEEKRTEFHVIKNTTISGKKNKKLAYLYPWTKNNQQQKLFAIITTSGFSVEGTF